MKNTKPLFIVIIILLIIALAWFLISSETPTEPEPVVTPDEEISEEIDELEQMRQDALVRWERNCEEEQNGVWIAEHEMCFTEENAEMLKESCEAMDGIWIEDSMLYECEIDGEMWKLGEWEMVEWEMYEEMRESCLDHGGEWIGGAEAACEIDGDVFYMGMWTTLDEMEESCIVEFGGEWLGGEETECEIDGVVYPGNWVQVFAMKDSCEDMGGEWIGGEDRRCEIDDYVYSRQTWERIDEMRDSCEDSGGVYLGAEYDDGDKFKCELNGEVYYNKHWERAAKAPSMGERCVEDGGDWNEETRTCQGLDLDWCSNIDMELSLRGLSWHQDTLSCTIY